MKAVLMGTNNVNSGNIYPNMQGGIQPPVKQSEASSVQAQNGVQNQNVIYNMPSQSLYAPQQQGAEAAQSSLLKGYIALRSGQINPSQSVQAVGLNQGPDGVWHNDMKEKLRGSKAQILAFLPYFCMKSAQKP